MKKLVLFLIAIFLLGFNNYNNAQGDNQKQQKTEKNKIIRTEIDNSHYWVKLAEQGLVPFNPPVPFTPAVEKGSQIITPDFITNSPDVAVIDAADVTQSENSIFIDPNDNQHIFNCNNSGDWTGATVANFYGSNYLFSANAGQIWTGSSDGAGGDNSGDPAACIGLNGRIYNGLILDRGQAVAYSDNETSWTTVVVGSDPGVGDLLDKNHLWIDNTNSSQEGNLYNAWTRIDAGHANDSEIEFSRSTNDGVTWSAPYQISSNVNAGSHNQGVNIQCNNTGWVFATWAIYDDWGTGVYNEDAIGFARSANGGVSFYSAQRIHSNINGIREQTNNPTGKNMRVNSFPSMAIDVSGGDYHGDIYIVWANVGVPGVNTGTNVSVYCMKSSNGGTIWDTPVRINTVASTDKAAFFPWITCDPVTGNLYCIFYDDRSFTTASSELETWLAYSNDGGATWDDFRISDVSFTPAPISGMAAGYMGDYLGVAARDGWVYPTWADNRSGNVLSYVSPLNFGGSCIATGGYCYEYINNVTIGSINNSSSCNGYEDFRELSTDIPLSGSASITISNATASYPTDQCGIWVDWNRDGDFYDANEEILVSGTPGPGSYTATIDPPAGTTPGECTLRARIMYTGTLDPCGTTTYGEVEDYTINLIATPGLWTGAVSTNWHTPGNWDDMTIPTITIDVTIPSGTPNQPTISSSAHAYCKNLNILSGATLTQIDISYLHVTGNFNSDAGTFTQSTGLSYLYFEGSVNTYWDDDNEDDTYRYVRIDKNINTSTLTMWQNMTVDVNFEVREGIFKIDANWILTINGTGSNAFEVEDGGTLQLINNQGLDVAGGIEFENGSQAIVTSGTMYCGGNFTSLSNTSYDIQLAGGNVVMEGTSTQSINNQDGGLEFHDLTIAKIAGTCFVTSNNLKVLGDVVISGGTLNPNSLNIYVGENWTNTVGDAGFDQSTGRVIFDGGNYHQYCSNETFNELEINKASGGAFRMDGTNVICAAYDWTAGAVDVLSGSFTANGLLDGGISGAYYLNTGGTIDLYAGSNGWVDLNGEIHIFGGTMNVTGTISDWPYSNNALIEMSGGVLDLTSCGITIASNAYTLTENISGGIIRTAGGFTGNSALFSPIAGTFEFYSTSDAIISQTNGCALYDVNIDKTAKGASSPSNSPIESDGRVDKTIGDGKASNISPSTDFVIMGNLDITAGSFTLAGHEVSVAHDCRVHGTLTMSNAADVLNVGSADYDLLWFYNSSTGNISAGNIYLYWGMIVDNGSSFTATTANTIHYNSAAWRGGIANDDPNTVFGNIDVNKPSGYFQIWTNGAQPIIVDGDFSLAASNQFEMQDLSMIVHGNYSDQALSETYLYNAFSKATKEGNNGSGSSSKSEESTIKGSGAKGGSLQIDNDFTLNGLLDVGDGDVLHHGYFNIASTGNLTISTGSYVCDYTLAAGWSVLGGFVNMTGGLLELTNASVSFTGMSNISGGVLRLGKSFQAAVVTAGFQPTGGTLELIGSTTSNYTRVSGGNTLNNFLFNRTGSYMIYPASTDDLIIKGDVEINSGVFNTNGNDMLIGGNWSNNAGSAAFTEGTSAVIFDGVYTADILTDETFYDVVVNKSAASYEGLELMTGLTLNVLHNLETIDGTLELNTNSTLIIGNDVHLGFESGVNAFGDLGLNIYVSGNWINDNTLWNTNYGYSPGTEVITFNGATDQTITTNAPKEDFGNLVIDKSTGQFRPNDNIDVMHDLLIADGQWNDNISLLTHYFEGNFEVSPAGAYFTHVHANTAVFKGTADQDITYNASGGYFYNVVIDKTDWPAKKYVEGGEIKEDDEGDQGKGPKALSVSLLTDLDMEFGDGLTIEEGILNLNGNTFTTMGDIDINDGGTLIVDGNAQLRVGNDNWLNVNSGGLLLISGTSGNVATIRKRSTAPYHFNILSGGTISAEYGFFDGMTGFGVFVQPGAIVDPAHAFNYCSFGTATAGSVDYKLTMNNDQVLVCTGANFLTAGETAYNVRKWDATTGSITFNAAIGDFAGPEYENDDGNMIHWGDIDLSLDLTAVLEGPFNGTNMNTDLNAFGLIPTSQPFNSIASADWYYTGSESVASIPANVVDWVLVRIKDATDAASSAGSPVVAEQAAFLLNDGTIVDLDGSSNLDFTGITYSDGLYPVVWHRNHLGIISSNNMIRSGGIYSYDFTQAGSAYTNTSAGEKLLGGGVYGMFSGDASAGGALNSLDVIHWRNQAGNQDYLQGDFNMDSQSDNKDKNDFCIDNFGNESQIPGSKNNDN